MTDGPQPTADDLALAREIYDREIALPKAPMSGSIDRIASLIAKHRQPEQSDERNLWNILDELQNALNILWRKGDGIPAFLEVQRKLHVWAREHYAKHRQPPPAMPAPTVAEVERLREALAEYAIAEEYDCPGDTPELCGYSCLMCKGFGETENTIEHKPDCLLAALPPPTMTIEEQMAEIDRKLATTPGIKFQPLKKLNLVRKGKPSLDELLAETERLRQALTRCDELIEAEQVRWQERIYEICQRVLPDVDGCGCDSGDPLDVTATEVSMTLNHLLDLLVALLEGVDDHWRTTKQGAAIVQQVADALAPKGPTP